LQEVEQQDSPLQNHRSIQPPSLGAQSASPVEANRPMEPAKRIDGEADPVMTPAMSIRTDTPVTRDPALHLYQTSSLSEFHGPDPGYHEAWYKRVFNPPHMQSARRVRLYGPQISTPTSTRSAMAPSMPLKSPSMIARLTDPPNLQSARAERLNLPDTSALSTTSANSSHSLRSFFQRVINPPHLTSAKHQRLSGISHTSSTSLKDTPSDSGVASAQAAAMLDPTSLAADPSSTPTKTSGALVNAEGDPAPHLVKSMSTSPAEATSAQAGALSEAPEPRRGEFSSASSSAATGEMDSLAHDVNGADCAADAMPLGTVRTQKDSQNAASLDAAASGVVEEDAAPDTATPSKNDEDDFDLFSLPMPVAV
jgi:hypothetical protein